MKAEKRIVGNVQSIDIFNKRLDNLIAMRGASGYAEYTTSDDEFSALLATNGTVVYADFGFYHYIVEAKTYHYEFPEKFCPIKRMEIYRDGDSYAYVSPGLGEGDPPFVEAYIVPKISETGGFVSTIVEYTYPLKDIAIAELEDARVGYDGTVYDTVGTAIREQIKNASAGTVRIAQGGDTATLDSMEIYEAYTSGRLPYFELAGFVFLPERITETNVDFTAVVLDDAMRPVLAVLSINAAGVISQNAFPLGSSEDNDDIGDVETAIDEILKIQNSLIGGNSV